MVKVTEPVADGEAKRPPLEYPGAATWRVESCGALTIWAGNPDNVMGTTAKRISSIAPGRWIAVRGDDGE